MGLSTSAFEVYATVLRARKRPGPLSEQLNKLIWWAALKMSSRLSRAKRHAILESIGPLLLPLVTVLLVVILILSFGLIYLPRLDTGFQFVRGAGPNWREALYFSGVTLLTIGYGDVTPHVGLMQFLALVEGVSGLAVLSLFTAYLLTVNEAVQAKRSSASSLYIQAGKGADVSSLLAHHYRRGAFIGLDELMRSSAGRLNELLESHVEHPVIQYFHSAAVYKSFPRFLFVLLELTTLIETVLDSQGCVDVVDHPETQRLRDTAITALKELIVLLSLTETMTNRSGPPKASLRHQISYRRALKTLRTAGVPVISSTREAFTDYTESRAIWEHGLFVVAEFLGYDWEELTGDLDPAEAYEDESSEVPLGTAPVQNIQ